METNLVVTDDQSILEYTRTKRVQLVEVLSSGPKHVPEDTKEQMILLNALDGLDRSALGRMRIESENQNAKNMTERAALIAGVLASINPSKTYVHETDRDLSMVILPSSIPVPEIIPGELDGNDHSLNYADFMGSEE